MLSICFTYSRRFEEGFFATEAADRRSIAGRLVDDQTADEAAKQRTPTQDVKPSETIHFFCFSQFSIARENEKESPRTSQRS